MAVVEKTSFDADNSWVNATVSKQPSIIYDHNLLPKYYEFRVLRNGKSIGAITCNTKKSSGEPVKFVLEFAPKYLTKIGGKSGKPDEFIVDRGYPSKT